MPMNPRTLRPSSTFTPKNISGLALWLDGADSSSLYTTDSGPVEAVSSPLDISGCALWLDASDASTISDTAGAVDQWDDKSGNARHFTGTTTSRPTTGTRTQNGRNVLDFDGNDFLLGNAASLNVLRNVPGGTAFVVGKIDAASGSQVFLAISRNGSNSATRFLIDTEPASGSWRAGGRRLDADAFGAATVAGSWDTNVNVLTGLLDYGNSDAFLYENGTLLNSNASFQTDGNTSDTDSDVVQLGATGGGILSFLDGFIGEMIVYPIALSPADRARVEAYLAAKWGIAGVHAPATATSDPVGYWRDKSGNGRHISTTDATKRPLVHSGLYNGRRVIDFDGVNDTLVSANYTTENARPGLTRFIVYHRDQGAALAHSATVYNGGPYSVTTNVSAAIRSYAGISSSADFGYTANNDVGSLGMWIAAYDGTAGNFADGLRLFFNGSNQPQVSTIGSFPSQTPGAGGPLSFYLGSNIGSNGFLNGKVAEYLSYTRALTDSERRKIELYLAAKWGITLAPQVANADAQGWIDRVYANGGTVSTSTANAVNSFCDAIDAAGIRDRFFRMGIFAGSNLNAALVPLYRSTAFGGTTYGNATDTNNGPFVSGDYAENDGLLGAASPAKYLRTGISPDTVGVATGHIAIDSKGDATSATALSIGASNDGQTQRYNLLSANANAFQGNAVTDFMVQSRWGTTSGTTYTTAGSAVRPSGLYIFTRTSSTRTDFYLAGVSVANSTASVTPAANANEFYVLAQNVNGSPNFTGVARARGYSIGVSLSGTQAADYNAAWTAMQTALGRT